MYSINALTPTRSLVYRLVAFFFFQAEDGIRDSSVTGVQTCALPISSPTATHRPDRSPVGASARAPCAALALLLLGAVAAAGLLAVLDTLGVQRAADEIGRASCRERV